MKVVITRPKYNTHIVSPPLGMGYLSSYLKKYGHEVKIIDGLNLDLDNDEIVRRSIEYGAKLVGIYCLSAFFLDAKDLANKLKKQGVHTVVGGAQATFLPEFTMEKTGAEFVVAGEAETTILDLVNALDKGESTENIPGLYTKDTKMVILREQTKNLDDIPFPDWEQIDPRKYKKAPHGGFIKHFPYAPITATRGCPYKCTFCASPKFSQGKIRRRSAKNVVDEIEYLVKNFGIKEIHFEDDNLTLHRPNIVDICNLILERKLKVSFACPNGVRADRVDEELLRLMKKTGFYYLAFGIESGNQQILDNVKKDTTIEKIRTAIELTNKVGIMSQGFFIFGLPGETDETIEQTIKFAKSLPLTRAQFLNLDVMPGTELWDTLGFEKSVDWKKNSYHEVTWIPPTVSEEALKKAPARAFKEFYLRPKQLFSMVRYIRVSQVFFLAKRLKDCGIFNINISRKKTKSEANNSGGLGNNKILPENLEDSQKLPEKATALPMVD